jgi:hypothetical protein
MVTVLRAKGLRVVIYLNDHLPAHVHVTGSGDAKINLVGSKGLPELISADGMSRADVRRAMALVTEHLDDLLEQWRHIHG